MTYWCSIWKFKWPVNQSLNGDLAILHVAFNCMRNQDISESSCETSITTWFDWVTRTKERADSVQREKNPANLRKHLPNQVPSAALKEVWSKRLIITPRASLTEWWNEASMRPVNRVSAAWSNRIEDSATTRKQDPRRTSVIFWHSLSTAAYQPKSAFDGMSNGHELKVERKQQWRR